VVVGDVRDPEAVTIRPAVAEDAAGIARTFVDSAHHHARLDSARYEVPPEDAITARYREGRQHSAGDRDTSTTLVAEVGGEIVGFVDVRLEQSPDPMHREITYCHIVEIAVGGDRQGRGIGRRLLRAAEDWGVRHGAQLASLEYLANNTGAAAFYERLGYHVASVTAIKRL
jgi:ribosomal protein S18 acetylase RimI-like enzyme